MMGDMPNENTNQTEPVTYEIMLAYNDVTASWLRADSVKTIECMCQGSHGDRMRVVTTDAPALEHAMDLDDDVPAGWRP
jgi:hypothetical protein